MIVQPKERAFVIKRVLALVFDSLQAKKTQDHDFKETTQLLQNPFFPIHTLKTQSTGAIVSSVTGRSKRDVTDVKQMFDHKWSLSYYACYYVPSLLLTPLSPISFLLYFL